MVLVVEDTIRLKSYVVVVGGSGVVVVVVMVGTVGVIVVVVLMVTVAVVVVVLEKRKMVV